MKWLRTLALAGLAGVLFLSGPAAALDPNFKAVGGGSVGKATASAGTVINLLVPPRLGAYSRITGYCYNCGTTGHTLTVLREQGRTTLSAAAASGQAVVALTADPGAAVSNPVAANHWVAWSNGDGTYSFGQVNSVSGLNVTLKANLGKALTAGLTFWLLGATTDTDPSTGVAFQQVDVPASTLTQLYDDRTGAGLFNTQYRWSPLLVQSNNATAAGTIEVVTYLHCDVGP